MGWIQAIKLRKREIDSLEKIWQFYQPSSCLSEKAFVLAHFTRQNIFFFKKKAQNQRAKLIFSK